MADTIYKLRLASSNTTEVFAERGTLEDIQLCLKTLFLTRKYTAPLYRDFGLDLDLTDQPSPRGMALIRNDMYDAVSEYEPRAEIVSVAFEQGDPYSDDHIVPVVSWRLKDGVEL